MLRDYYPFQQDLKNSGTRAGPRWQRLQASHIYLLSQMKVAHQRATCESKVGSIFGDSHGSYSILCGQRCKSIFTSQSSLIEKTRHPSCMNMETPSNNVGHGKEALFE